MKRIFLSVAILAAAASCSKSVDVATPQGDAIGFSTLNDRVTKVANINGVGATNTNDNYQVYANVSDQTAWLIDEEIVASTDAIDSGNIYYWPGNDDKSVNFYAYAPMAAADLLVETATPSTTSIPLEFTVPEAANIDFTVAAPVTEAKYDVKAPKGEVPLAFSHMLSKASMSVKLLDELQTSLILTFKNATFAVDNNIVKADAIDQSSSSEAGAGSYTIGVEDASGTAETKVTYNSTNDLFFAPQTGTGCSITLNNVEVKTKVGENLIFSGNMTYNLDDATHSFVKGTAYNFAITVDPGLKVITFKSTENPWTPAGSNVELK